MRHRSPLVSWTTKMSSPRSTSGMATLYPRSRNSAIAARWPALPMCPLVAIPPPSRQESLHDVAEPRPSLLAQVQADHVRFVAQVQPLLRQRRHRPRLVRQHLVDARLFDEALLVRLHEKD